jgi:hypothetical protein
LENYSLGLALFDFIPVLLSLSGLLLLANLIGNTTPSARWPALAGALLVGAGGLSKASWKLCWVLTRQDLAVLDNLLFILMAPGFAWLACQTYSAQRVWRGGTVFAHSNVLALTLSVTILGASLIATTGGGEGGGRGWFFVLLGSASLANIYLSGLLIRLSWTTQQRVTASLFLFSILLVLALGNLARFSAGSAPLQWLAEFLNALAHGTFALAVWRIRPYIHSGACRVSR